MSPARDASETRSRQPLPFRLAVLALKSTFRLRGIITAWLIRAAGGRCGGRLMVEGGVRLRHGYHSGLRFGSYVYLGRSTTIDCPPGASLTLGDRVTLTEGVFLGAYRGITIGHDVMIGEYSSVRDANHGMETDGRVMWSQPMSAVPIMIDDDVWIGRGCAVLAGASLGWGAVVAANSVVRGTVDATTIVGGVPARTIGARPGPGLRPVAG